LLVEIREIKSTQSVSLAGAEGFENKPPGQEIPR
jgi:hypothetical protein